MLMLWLAVASPSPLAGQTGPAPKPAEPFKVGTFEIDGVPSVGLVLRDSLIVDLEKANRALQTNPRSSACRCRETCSISSASTSMG
jgi:hypothetical protein